MKVGLGIASNAEETARAIERDYRMTAAHQWARELFVNSQQAGATRILFGFHASSAQLGIWRTGAFILPLGITLFSVALILRGAPSVRTSG